MKAIDFVNSKDIREYWEEIGYESSALESAWLIWQGKNQSLNEKHLAWSNLIDSSTDCSIPAGAFDLPQKSLHNFLSRYIEIDEELIKAFYTEGDHAVFSYRMYFDDDGDREWYNEPAMFNTFEEAYEHAKDGGEPPHPNFIEFVKTYIGSEGKQIFVRFNLEKEIVRVDESDYLTDSKDYEIFQEVFRNMSFAFPIPFKKGDIVSTTRGLYTRPSYSGGTYVFENVVTEDNCTFVTGYGVDGNGVAYYHRDHDYMDLVRNVTPLINEDKMLLPISKYLSGEIDLALLLGACKHIFCSNEAKKLNLYMNYTKEEKKLAGVDNES